MGLVPLLILKMCFYHVPLHMESRKYTRFMMDGVIWQYTSLPMGLTSSPRVFTELTGVLLRHLRKRGMIIIIYLDDLLMIAMSRRKSEEDTVTVLNLLRQMGFLVNEPKSSLEPNQVFLYLGLWWNLVSWTISLASHRVKSLKESAKVAISRELRTCRNNSCPGGESTELTPSGSASQS